LGHYGKEVLFNRWQEQHHQAVAVSTGRPEESGS